MLQPSKHLMKRLTWLIVLVALTSVRAVAQEKKSISTTLSGLDVDTAKVNVYIKRADDMMAKGYSDSVLILYYDAYLLAKQIDYDRAIVYTLCKVGDLYYNRKKKFTQSKITLYQVLPHLPRLSLKDRQRFIPMTYNLLANALFMNGQYDSAIYYYSAALNAMKDLSVDNPKVLVEIYSNMGAVLSASGQYIKGADYLKKTLSYPTIDSDDLAKNYGNLGSLYANFLHDMDSATYWWQHAIPIYKALNMKGKLQDIYANMGTGWSLIPHQDFDKAQRYFDTAIAIDPAAADHNIQLQQGLSGTSYYKGAYKEAIRYALRSLDIVAATGDREKQLYAYWTLSYCYEHLGDTMKAHDFQRRLAFLDDSLRNEKIMRSINESESKYRLFEKNNELAENKIRLYHQQLWLIGILGGSIMLIGLLLGAVYFIKQKQRLQLDRLRDMEQQQKIEHLHVKMEAEENERARIARELHDGLGVLLSAAKINHNLLGKTLPEGLRSHTAFKDSGSILDHIYDEVRLVTQNLIPDYIAHKSLEDALTILISKLDTPKFGIRLQSYGDLREIHPEISFAIYRAIEEIVNNAVRHSGGSELVIQLLYHSDQLHITTEDNGNGFDPHKNYRGLGLGNIVRRIEKIGGFITLSATTGKGTMYIMEIPY